MSDVEIGAISGGSGSFVTQKFFSGSVSVGATGDILTITAPLGKRVRLDYLASTITAETGVELYVDGALVNQSLTSLGEVSSEGSSEFKVIQGGNSTVGSISDVVGREIILKKTDASTSSGIRYAYSEGV